MAEGAPRIFAAGALVGGVAGALAAALVTAGFGGSDAGPEALAERVVVLEEEVQRVEAGVGLEAGALRGLSAVEIRQAIARAAAPPPSRGRGPDGDADGDDAGAEEADPHAVEITGGLLEPSVAVDDDFVSQVRAALARIEDEKSAAQAEEKRRNVHDWYLREVNKRLEELREPLGLDDGEIARIRALANDKIEERQAAEFEGAPKAELDEIDRVAQAGVREVLGDARYLQYRKLEIDRMARPIIAKVSSLAGVDAGQRKEIEGLLSAHLDRIAPDEARIRSEKLDPAERERLRTGIDALNTEAWRRLREDILTDEQRGRVPKRLR